jgi:hypothetical protein
MPQPRTGPCFLNEINIFKGLELQLVKNTTGKINTSELAIGN